MSAGSIFFVCDAGASIGFGHLSRCLQVAEVLRGDRAIRFCGHFSPEALRRIARRGFAVAPAPARNSGGLAVVDTMFDKEDMDYYDVTRLQSLRRRFVRVAIVSSALTVPARLPADVVIGHMLRRARGARRLRVLAGLSYAPVSSEFRRARRRRTRERARIRRVFLGFGGSRDIRGLKCVLDALALWNFTGEVDILLSPFHERFEPSLRRRASSRVRIHSNVKAVAPLLRRADVAFGTYGNITFEALCLGVPFLVIAVKDFQRAYAARLAREGVLVSLGRDSDLDPKTVVAALESLTRRARTSLSRKGREAVDGRGIERIARVVAAEAREAEREMACRA